MGLQPVSFSFSTSLLHCSRTGSVKNISSYSILQPAINFKLFSHHLPCDTLSHHTRTHISCQAGWAGKDKRSGQTVFCHNPSVKRDIISVWQHTSFPPISSFHRLINQLTSHETVLTVQSIMLPPSFSLPYQPQLECYHSIATAA